MQFPVLHGSRINTRGQEEGILNEAKVKLGKTMSGAKMLETETEAMFRMYLFIIECMKDVIFAGRETSYGDEVADP